MRVQKVFPVVVVALVTLTAGLGLSGMSAQQQTSGSATVVVYKSAT
jgi:hypothetical protein